MGKIAYPKGIRGDQDEERISEFYDIMKETVVQILVHDENDELAVLSGTYINEKGDVLTSSHMLPAKFKSLRFQTQRKDIIVLYAPTIYRCQSKNLALIKNQDALTDHICVTFAKSNTIKSGSNIRMISHRSETMAFSATRGKTSYLGTYLDFFSRLPKKVIDGREVHDLKGCKEDLHLIELIGLDGHKSSIGAPVFNNFGKMIGMHICLDDQCPYEYAIHVDVVEEFMKECAEGKWLCESATNNNKNVFKGKGKDDGSGSSKHVTRRKLRN